MDDYERRVRRYEAEGMTRSDAQATVEAEDILDDYCKEEGTR